MSPVIVSDGRVSHRLGSSHEWPLSLRSVEWSPSHMAHQLSGDASSLSSTEIFPPRPERSPCVGAHRQHSGGLLHQPPGGSALAPVVQTGTPDPLVVPGQVPLTESTVYSWVPECGTRRTVETGAEARGMDASPRGGEADIENVLSGGGGPLRNSSECAMSPLVLSSSSSSPRTGRYGTDMAEAASVRLSPDRSAPGSSDESTPRRCSPTVSSPVLAGPSMVLGPDFPPRRLSMEDSRQEGNHPTTCPLDPIPTHLLQAISSSVIPALTHIINTSLHTGTFPTAFKQARVSPLLKKPALNPALLENYRPVSLLPFIAKSLERVVFNQLSLFLAQNNILDNNQSGFRSGHSTETALLSVTEALRLARAASKSSVLILLDLSAAFDTVNHQILMSILRKMGFSGTALLWFESYLSDRSFRVSWRGEVSKSQLLATGVPQGSVLGPLLFSIYMSSLGSVIQKHGFSYHCYADDTQLYFSFQPDDPTVTDRIAACLSDISSWMMDHHLQLNLAKTELLVFSANPSLHHNFSIQLGSSTITPSRTARNLGVVIDDQLSFTDHIATTARSCRFALYNIRKIRPFLSEQAAQLLVQALVLSRLDYCNALLAGLPACTIKPLQLIQNAAARVVFNEPKKAHVTPLFIRLHWLPIAARIKFKVLMFAYKTTTGTAPIYLNSLVQTYAPSRSLRSASERRLVVPSQRGTKSLSRTFTWTVPSWWNDLPISIRTAESLAIFKKHLKTHLFRQHLTN